MHFPNWYVQIVCWAVALIGLSGLLFLAFWALGEAMVYVRRVIEAESVVVPALLKHVREKQAREDAAKSR